jgi:hypothetical protein
MPRTTTRTQAEPRWVQARDTFLYIEGARAPEWRKIVVRNKRTGQLAEVPLVGEEDPVDPGDEGTTYVLAKGEKVLSDHPAVVARPGYFIDVPPGD